ncbi:hypothetical protein DO97_12830 [Neosynechococcus sphagnicola sy1]|uniref:Ketohydroxyglutarate aldolase n=1 Tax=Neosynechococcus sphagnicola sy1 TaxID=1497020 RepID=A0A098TSE9_9CYAN|nr:bifunctional 4-hydroxy-2-oxoglutarate aldolase/2-dehydro-3-deoxy-phosphogluconate aldolase [Neosynechococcus sphagnicola]KGF73698.1 hypothetical protein DO97_12830 [Neosynechococcus sphagnicola sy1]
MAEDFWLAQLKQQRAIAVIRAAQFALGQRMAWAVATGGMTLIEITWNTHRGADLIRCLRRELPHCLIGAGTILTLSQLEQAITAGAQFLFSPHTNAPLIQAALQQGIPIVPGALTPTEIVTAWQLGASCVKVFPVERLGGVDYLRSLHPVLTEIPLIPTGGVTLANAPAFIQAGAIAVGLSSELFPPWAIAAGNWSMITAQARQLCQSLQQH